MSERTRRIAMTGIMAAVICLLAPLSIPLSGGVPISLATFVVMLAAALLGPVMGTEATLVYILVGLIGLPVFSSYQAGAGVLLGPTGGYIIGYLPLAFMTGLFSKKISGSHKGISRFSLLVAGMLLGTALCYLLGTAWFVWSTKTGWLASLSVCVVPFLPFDLLKMVVVGLAAPKIESLLTKAVRANA